LESAATAISLTTLRKRAAYPQVNIEREAKDLFPIDGSFEVLANSDKE
jgi:hypothetical protein